ncbi:MAG: glycosyltransferase family 4 protein [Saprospiraceae bacterium]|nr:glycosyltransferase family 4 protein [Saprospiraceae bacterium]
MPLKSIILDCERMKYSNTGLYHYCLNLGRNLEICLDSGKEELFFYTPTDAQTWTKSRQNHITQYSFHKLVSPNTTKFNIWHASHQDSEYIPYRNSKIKMILTVHDLNFLYNDQKSNWKKNVKVIKLQKRIDRADAIICISEFTKQDLIRNCELSDKPIYVIYNGSNALTKAELSNDSYRPVKSFIFTLGVINRKKNYQAILPLLKAGNLELVIAGKIENSDYYQSIYLQAEKNGVRNQIHIVGPISESEKSWYFHHCYAFILPSLSEGFGLTAIEAMSCGKPVFLSNRTSLPEVGGNAAFYFGSFDEEYMIKVFREGMDRYSKEYLSDKIIKYASKFSWEKAAKEYLQVYRTFY